MTTWSLIITMASSGGSDFEPWLRELLDSYGADGEVFGEYVGGTLNTMEDSTEDETYESLLEILQGCVENDSSCKELSKKITERWMQEMQQRKERVEAEKLSQAATIKQEAKSSLPSASGTEPAGGSSGGMSAEEKKKLIAQYDCESDEEEEYDDRVDRNEPGGLFQNTNKATLAEGLKQKKEQQKAAHEAKLERDKRSREMQKQKAQERKEKEKKRTQKHERRR